MAGKKKAAKKAASQRTPRGAAYELTTTGKNKLTELNGQQKIVFEALEKHQPISAAALGEKVAGKLETRQDPGRVAAFYLHQWKTDGFVKAVKQAKAAKAAA